MICLKEIKTDNVIAVCTLRVAEHQKDYVAENVWSLAEAYAARNAGYHAWPMAIYWDETPVGFVMIGKGTVGDEAETPFMRKNYCIWRFMIDERYQHQGYGREAFRQVLEWIRKFPAGKSAYVWLSYEPENEYARAFYRKNGFQENGEWCDDERMAVLPLV